MESRSYSSLDRVVQTMYSCSSNNNIQWTNKYRKLLLLKIPYMPKQKYIWSIVMITLILGGNIRYLLIDHIVLQLVEIYNLFLLQQFLMKIGFSDPKGVLDLSNIYEDFPFNHLFKVKWLCHYFSFEFQVISFLVVSGVESSQVMSVCSLVKFVVDQIQGES